MFGDALFFLLTFWVLWMQRCDTTIRHVKKKVYALWVVMSCCTEWPSTARVRYLPKERRFAHRSSLPRTIASLYSTCTFCSYEVWSTLYVRSIITAQQISKIARALHFEPPLNRVTVTALSWDLIETWLRFRSKPCREPDFSPSELRGRPGKRDRQR